MSQFFTQLHARYKQQFLGTGLGHALYASFTLLLSALVINYFGALYALERASSFVEDIILSNIPVFDVDWIFVWGPLIFWIIIAIILILNPRKIPFTLKSIAFFILIRSLFVSLTHIGPFPDHLTLNSYSVQWMNDYFGIPPFFSFVFSSGSDLFFSAHTGLPFLMALVFWENRLTRIYCITSSIFFAAIVLMGHLHYSIDVASAFFITYTIYKLATHTFKGEYERFYTGYTHTTKLSDPT